MAHKIISETADFRMYEAETYERPNGNVRAFRACEELEGGRWEGFVAIEGEWTAQEWKSKGKAIMARLNA